MPELVALDYFLAPASTKFHLCTRRGLLMHSVNVVNVALDLSERFCPFIPYERIIITALLHDVGKCGLLDAGKLHPRYIKNTEPYPSWPKQQKWWTPYIYADSKPMFTIRDLSALYCSRWGLEPEVLQAVMVHDGAFEDANKKYGMNSTPLAYLITAADYFCATTLETKDAVITRRYQP